MMVKTEPRARYKQWDRKDLDIFRILNALIVDMRGTEGLLGSLHDR